MNTNELEIITWRGRHDHREYQTVGQMVEQSPELLIMATTTQINGDPIHTTVIRVQDIIRRENIAAMYY